MQHQTHNDDLTGLPRRDTEPAKTMPPPLSYTNGPFHSSTVGTMTNIIILLLSRLGTGDMNQQPFS